MADRVRHRYEELVASGEIDGDASQRALADRLDALAAELDAAARPNRNVIGKLLGRESMRVAPRGLYIFGGVGRGKTLLMDLLFEELVTAAKRRAHFHAFMAETHDRIAELRQGWKREGAKGGDPIAPVAQAIADEIRLLCFDEFSVSDIADAMVLGRLFEQLFARGVTVVATSNVSPDDLYKDGLNRALFVPFIALLKQYMAVFHLEAPRDYRLDDTGTERRYVTPHGPEGQAILRAQFRHLAGQEHGIPRKMPHKGRSIEVPEAAGEVAFFRFEELCGRPLAGSDYLRLAREFHTIILADVPVLDQTRRNEAKRLINLVDTLYDNHVRIVVSAAAEPSGLWRGSTDVETREFARTASRLVEMQSDDYWEESGAHRAQTKKARA